MTIKMTAKQAETIRWAEDRAKELMFKFLGGSWSFMWSRSKKTFGYCQYNDQIIALSKFLTKTRSQSAIENTILHEIAHALAGYEAAHGPEWKKIARQIGATPKATAPLSAETTKSLVKEAKWQMINTLNGEVVQSFHRYPSKVAREIHTYYIPGYYHLTLGKLKLVQKY